MPLIGTIIEVPACCWDTTLYEGRLGGPRWLCAHEYVLVCTLHFVDDIRIILVPSHEFWNNLHCTLEIKVAWILFRKLVLCFSFRQWSVIQLNSYWLYYFIDRPNVMEHLESTSIYDRYILEKWNEKVILYSLSFFEDVRFSVVDSRWHTRRAVSSISFVSFSSRDEFDIAKRFLSRFLEYLEMNLHFGDHLMNS